MIELNRRETVFTPRDADGTGMMAWDFWSEHALLVRLRAELTADWATL